MRYREEECFCEVDGISLDEHERCHRCQILVGPGHWEQGQEYEGGVLCSWCVADLALDQHGVQPALVPVDYISALSPRADLLEEV